MKSEIVLQVDATVIIGIIILMTFQSFSSGTYEKQFGEVITLSRELHSEEYALKSFSQNCNEIDKPTCTEIDKRLLEIRLIREGTEEWVENLGVANEFEDFHSNLIFFSTGAAIIANVINLAMVFPFAFSAIFESLRIIKKNDRDDDASNIAIKFMILGFVMVIVGFIGVIVLMSCATFVDLNCLGVNDWFNTIW